MTDQVRSAPYRLIRITVLFAVLAVFMMAAHPVRVPAMLLVVPFLLMFACLYYAVLEIIRLFRPPSEGQALPAVHRPRLLAALIAAFPVLLLVLQSIMELTRWDVVIALALFLLAYVFISRGTLPGSH